MNLIRNATCRLTMGLFLWTVIGCGSPHANPTGVELVSTSTIPYSGFLSDYSGLAPSRNPETAGAMVFLNPQKNLRLYKIAMIEPFKVVLRPDAAAQRVDPNDLKSLARFFENEVRGALKNRFPVVSTPGFGVMRIRAAIVDIAPNLSNVQGIRSRPFIGAAAVEIELLDSLSGEQIAAAVVSDNGRVHRIKNSMVQYGFAKDLLRLWSLQLVDALDEAKGLHRGSQVRSTGNLFR